MVHCDSLRRTEDIGSGPDDPHMPNTTPALDQASNIVSSF